MIIEKRIKEDGKTSLNSALISNVDKPKSIKIFRDSLDIQFLYIFRSSLMKCLPERFFAI